MQLTSVHAPLHFLFHKAFLCGETGYGESGTKFSLRPRPGETILVFRTDDGGEGGKKSESKGDGGKKSEKTGAGGGTFREHFGIKKDEKCSDLLLFYALEQPGKPFRYRLAFIELKGTDAARGVEQLDRAMLAVKSKLPAALGSSFFNPDCLRAIILSSMASPDPSYTSRLGPFSKKWQISPILCHPLGDIRAHLLG
jgi:hypothetical protein